MTPPPAARSALVVLLEGLVDFAGLFPPAGLPMRDSVQSYEEYRNGPTAWALGRFVVTADRLPEFEEQFVAQYSGGPLWRLSVLAGPGDRLALHAFNARFEGRAVVDTVEGKAATVAEIGELESLAPSFATYVEIPVANDPAPLVVAVGTRGLRAKVRTGGMTAAAIPSSEHVVRFLAACAVNAVPFKATAGLHHPWRGVYRLSYDPRSLAAEMFGFLNVFVAACFLREGMSEPDAVSLIEERDPAAITFDSAGVHWRGRHLGISRLRVLRSQFATSFGSCSFTEPIADLVAFGLL